MEVMMVMTVEMVMDGGEKAQPRTAAEQPQP